MTELEFSVGGGVETDMTDGPPFGLSSGKMEDTGMKAKSGK